MIDQLIQLVYLVATALFIFSLKWMSDPTTARRGVFAGVGGMALAIIGTMMHPLIIGYSWIAIPFVLAPWRGFPCRGCRSLPFRNEPHFRMRSADWRPAWSEPRSTTSGPNMAS